MNNYYKTSNIFKSYEFDETKAHTGTYYQEMRRNMKNILKTDFKEFAYLEDGHWRHKVNNRLLLSSSSILHLVNKLNMDGIPKNVLEQAKICGEQLMLTLKEIFDKKEYDLSKINFLSTQIEEMVKAVLNWLIEKQFKIRAIEKFVCNYSYCGFIDMIATDTKSNLDYIIEIKTRGDDEPRLTDAFQLSLYKRITEHKRLMLLILNKKTMKVKSYLFVNKEGDKVRKMVLNPLYWLVKKNIYN